MKTKYERIKEKQKKARNEEILYQVKRLFNSYDDDKICEILKDIIIQLNTFGSIRKIEKYIPQGYKLVEIAEEIKDE